MLPWLIRLASDSEDTARDCWVAKARSFAASPFVSAFARSVTRRIGAKPGPARDVPQTIERRSSARTGPSRAVARPGAGGTRAGASLNPRP